LQVLRTSHPIWLLAVYPNDSPADLLRGEIVFDSPASAVSLADDEQQMRVNATAAFVLCQAITPGMVAKGHGKIVNFCSLTLNGRWQGYVL